MLTSCEGTIGSKHDILLLLSTRPSPPNSVGESPLVGLCDAGGRRVSGDGRDAEPVGLPVAHYTFPISYVDFQNARDLQQNIRHRTAKNRDHLPCPSTGVVRH